MNVHVACITAQFFQIKDLCLSRRLNRSWLQHFDHPALFNYIRFDIVAGFPSRVLRSFPYARRLQLAFYDASLESFSFLRELRFTSDAPFDGLCSYFEHTVPNTFLCRLELSNCELGIEIILHKFPRLTALYLHYKTPLVLMGSVTSFGCIVDSSTSNAAIDTSLLADITSLHLFQFQHHLGSVHSYFSAFRALVSLVVPISNLKHLVQISKSATHVENLTVIFHGYRNMLLESFVALTMFGARLKRLSVTFQSITADLRSIELLCKLTSLQYLEIHGGQIYVFRDDLQLLKVALPRLPSLREFRCINCLTDLESSFRFPDAMGSLRYIQIAHVSKVFG